MERVKRIELSRLAWEARALPLSYTRWNTKIIAKNWTGIKQNLNFFAGRVLSCFTILVQHPGETKNNEERFLNGPRSRVNNTLCARNYCSGKHCVRRHTLSYAGSKTTFSYAYRYLRNLYFTSLEKQILFDRLDAAFHDYFPNPRGEYHFMFNHFGQQF